MKNLLQWANKRIDYLSVWDIGGIKWASFTFGLMIASIFPKAISDMKWPFWLILTILFMLKPIHGFYFNKRKIKR